MAYAALSAIADATKAFATDLISGSYFSRVKIAFGVEGSATDVSSAAPFPVTVISGVTTGLTDAQLRATPVPVSGTVTVSGVATASAQTTGNASLASIDGKTPALSGGMVPVVPPTNATTTRAYAIANGLRTPFASTSTTEAAFPTLGASREIRFAASARCWVKWGATGLTAAAAESASFVLEANAPEVLTIPVGATHFRVIRDAVDGNLHMAPVA